MSSANDAPAPTTHTWGFIGLGSMGGPMVLNLRQKLPAADRVLAFDINREAAANIANAAAGSITVAPDLASIARDADTIIACLPTPAVAEQVFTDMVIAAGTLLSSANTRPRMIIDCSTIDPVTSRRICSKLQTARFGKYIDAPISGGVVGARAGTLSFMVGCSASTFAVIAPTLSKMGRRITRCGAQGTGLAAKLANNYLLAITNLATAEAMNFGVKAGLHPNTLADIINGATGRNWASEVNNPVPGVVPAAPASRGYEGGFAIRLMNKDLGLAVAAAKGVDAALPLADVAELVYGRLSRDEKYAALDFSVVYRCLQEGLKAKL